MKRHYPREGSFGRMGWRCFVLYPAEYSYKIIMFTKIQNSLLKNGMTRAKDGWPRFCTVCITGGSKKAKLQIAVLWVLN